MSITFSSGGFSGNMRTDAEGNIFIDTHQDAKKITLGGIIEYSGSTRRVLDRDTKAVH